MAKIYLRSNGGTVVEFGSFLYRDCVQFCEENNYEWVDENGFVWEMVVE